MPAADEQQLILRVKEGDQQAFRILMERHMRQAYSVAYGFVNDHDLAKDVTQEAFVRAYEAIPAFRGEAGFGTWLYRIVTNLSMNHLRQRRSRQRHEMGLDESTMVPPQPDGLPARSHELQEHIERVLHELPTLQRAVVILRHFDGLSTRQVSEILRISEGTVKTHLFRGLRKMRERLQFLQNEA
jgi:RNA polymerase sigma-70 factor (ECF subfamily)